MDAIDNRGGPSDKPRRLVCCLAIILCIQAALLMRQFAWAAQIFCRTMVMLPEKRRLFIMPGQYGDALRVNQRVPPGATIWFVSPHTPSDIGYFLFPRRLRWGSAWITDREAIRHRYPNDWVLTNQSDNPPLDALDLFPPIGPAER